MMKYVVKISGFLLVLLAFSATVYAAKKSEQKEHVKKSASEGSKDSSIVVDEKAFSKRYLERQILYYEQKAKEFQSDIRALLKKTVEEKQRQVADKYDKVIDKETKKELEAREDAIILFEQFIKKYPRKPSYTPRALYRLAELYYEKAVIEQDKANDKYEQQVELFEKGELKKEPVPPTVDFSKSVALYRRIIGSFPNFSYLGAVYYMLGYCLNEQGDADKAVAVWKTIIDKGIATEYLAEIYLRIGDYYFDNNNLDESLKYFSKGVVFQDSPFYDKILYKLAWTYYRRNDFEQAIDTFITLIRFADEMKEKGEDRGQDLRKESIQYIAISYADEEWGSVDKAIKKFNSFDGSAFEWNVFELLGKYYYENGNYPQSELAYTYLLKKHPYSVHAPDIHKKLIQLYYKINPVKASYEVEQFALLYGKNSRWALQNRADVTAVRKAVNMAQVFLLDTARYHHQSAQTLKGKGEFDKAKAEYEIAAKYYNDYLEKFPYTADSYDIMFDYADALFYANDVGKALVMYVRVRDDKNQTKHREEAAYQVFYILNDLWEKSDESKMPSEEKRGKPLTLLESKLIEASDIYLKVTKDAKDASGIAYVVARIFFDHGKFDEAEKRYLKIINNYPSSPSAVMAARDIISAYNAKNDWINVAKWSKILTDRLEQSGSMNKDISKEFKTYRTGALFKYAEKLEEDKKYREAAEEYLRLVKENPYTKNADKALYNAALNFQRAAMYESALKILERVYKEYPYSELAPTALFLVASNAERSFNFSKAVSAYKEMVDKYPAHKKSKDALWNLALLLEHMQNYTKAARYYKKFSEVYPSDPAAKQALYSAGEMYFKAKKWKRTIAYFNNYIDEIKGSSDARTQDLIFRALHKIADIYEDKLKNHRKAREYWQKMVDLYTPAMSDNPDAPIYVAESAFRLLEDEFEQYKRITFFTTKTKVLKKLLNRKTKMLKELQKKYQIVEMYGAAEWIAAALYMQGALLENYAHTWENAALPKRIKGVSQDAYDDVVDNYRNMLEERTSQFEDKAVKNYELALETLKHLKLYNVWVKKIQERLAILQPDTYKFGRPLETMVVLDYEVAFPVVVTLDRSEKKKYVKQELFSTSPKKQSDVPVKEPTSEKKGE